jgi:peptidyl-prolyl cis-trans isomerase SurA
MKTRPDLMSTPLRQVSVMPVLDKIGEQFVFAVKGEEVERSDPQFAALMKEYRDGILLYQIEQERVWGRIAVNDSILRSYFNQNREKFVYPDRIAISELHTPNDSVAHVIYAHLKSGSSIEQVALADSIRMAARTTYPIVFAQGSSRLPGAALKKLGPLVAELKSDHTVSLRLTGHIDTTHTKAHNEQLALQRFDALRKYFSSKYGIVKERVTSTSLPQPPGSSWERGNEITIDITGRRATLTDGVVSSLLPTNTDDRTRIADSLSPGAYSTPFRYKGSMCIVRLDRREPSRLKTFEEANPEVSSAFQDYESKRLEAQWLDGLRKSYPVTEYKSELKNAFGPVQ